MGVACGWSDGRWTGHCSDSCTKNTMLKLLDLTRKYPVLKTWSWFGYNNFGNLWENDPANGYPLTELGQMYFANCNPHGFSDSIVNKSSASSPSPGPIGPNFECDNNPPCAALGLAGNCCPTNDGVMLDCCPASTAQGNTTHM